MGVISHLIDLPDQILSRIFSHLDSYTDKCNLSLSCASLRRARGTYSLGCRNCKTPLADTRDLSHDHTMLRDLYLFGKFPAIVLNNMMFGNRASLGALHLAPDALDAPLLSKGRDTTLAHDTFCMVSCTCGSSLGIFSHNAIQALANNMPVPLAPDAVDDAALETNDQWEQYRYWLV